MRHADRARGAVIAALLLPALAGCRSSGPRDVGGVVVDVRGEAQVSEGDLYAAAGRELAAFRTGRLRAAAASDAAFTMEHHLRDLGYAHAHVSFRLLPDEDAPTELIFDVEEGPRAELVEITFPGRRTVDEEDLRAFLRQRFRLAIGATRWYRHSEIEEAVNHIENLYVLRGHHRVRVGPPEVTWNDDRTEAHVAIPIHEGRRFTVSRVVLEGELPEGVRDSVRAMVGAPFHRRLAAEAAARIRGRLREEGYQFCEARGRWELDPPPGEGGNGPTASIFVEVRPGNRVVIRRWEIAGLERTDRGFAEGLVEIEPGGLARQSEIDDAIDALYGTGAFGSVRLRSEPIDETSDPEDHDLFFDVEERDARSYEVGGGWGSYEKLRGWTGYRDRNFMGLSRLLDVVVHGSTKSAGVTSRVTDRYILGPRRTLSVGGRFESREEPSFDSDSFEGDVTVRQRAGDDHVVFMGYRIRIDTADDLDVGRRRFEERRTRAAGVNAGVVHDTRDDRLFPSTGALSEVALFLSDEALGADLDFLEWKVNWARYLDVGRGSVLAVGFRFTTRDIRDDRTTLPIQERLFLGGETTVRSFGESELGPTDLNNDPLGGLTRAMASIELRRPLWYDLDGALFYDIGTVSEESWDLDDVGAAIGVGLRYRLPIGPVRLDFAYNPEHRFAASRRWALHLSFGFSF